MKSLLVISDEPALGEILANELPECNVTRQNIQEAQTGQKDKNNDLVVIDGELTAPSPLPDNSITIKRPVRLKALMQEIEEKLRGKLQKQDVNLGNGYFLSLASRTVYTPENPVSVTLTEKECELLEQIAGHREPILSRQLLLKAIWGYSEAIDTHTLETHLYRLRIKLKQASEELDIGFSEERGYYLNQLQDFYLQGK